LALYWVVMMVEKKDDVKADMWDNSTAVYLVVWLAVEKVVMMVA
jgi:hypothetical protein